MKSRMLSAWHNVLAHVVNGLQNGFCDFLGNVFMQLELGG